MFVSVYDKGWDRRPHGITDPRVRVTPLVNAGREGRTWLSHILDNYDKLAAWTYFAQGEPHQEPAEFLRRLKVPYRDTTGLTREYMPHFPPAWIKDQDAVEWHEVGDGGPPVEVRYGRAIYQGGRTKAQNEAWLRRLWAFFFQCPPPDPIEEWVYAYGAMYAVPRRRITDRPLEFWKWCHDVIARRENQEEHAWGSGYAFELLWPYLFGPAERYPIRLPDDDEARVTAEVANCPHASGSCGCGPVPRECSHPAMTPQVWARDCRDCPFRPALDWFPRTRGEEHDGRHHAAAGNL